MISAIIRIHSVTVIIDASFYAWARGVPRATKIAHEKSSSTKIPIKNVTKHANKI